MTKYYKVIKIALMSKVEYRFDFIFGLISKFLPVIIQIFMWTAIYNNSQDTIILNYTYKQMILYTVMSIFISTLVSVDVHWVIANDIKNGTLSKYLILPINYFFFRVFNFIGSKILEIIIVIIGLLIALNLLNYEISLMQIGITAITVILAIIIQYLICYCISNVAFWIVECGGVFTVVNVISLIISGAIFPLDIFGQSIVNISKIFPFYYTTYFPTNVLIGKFNYIEIFNGLSIMLVWIFLLSIISTMLWRNGIKKYIAIGG